jgi:hypothetical protein
VTNSHQNIFTGIVNLEGDIHEFNGYRMGAKIGIDNQRESELIHQITEMQECLDAQYTKLVEHGIIVPPKTAEQLAAEQLLLAQETAAEQSKINSELLKAINGLQTQISALQVKGAVENEFVEHGVDVNQRSDRPDFESVGTKPTGNKFRNNKGKGNVAGDNGVSDTENGC